MVCEESILFSMTSKLFIHIFSYIHFDNQEIFCWFGGKNVVHWLTQHSVFLRECFIVLLFLFPAVCVLLCHSEWGVSLSGSWREEPTTGLSPRTPLCFVLCVKTNKRVRDDASLLVSIPEWVTVSWGTDYKSTPILVLKICMHPESVTTIKARFSLF